MQEYVIETRHIQKKYGKVAALKDVNLHLKRGSIYGLIGDNGAGKSTLLKVIAGQSYATSGSLILFNQEDNRKLELSRRRIGFLVEQPGFAQNLTVEQVLHYYCIQRGVVERDKVYALLQLVGIEQEKKSVCTVLSQGQKQRLGLAIAMLGDPEVLVLDEPINGLDPSGIVEIRNILKRLAEEKNITILLSSHILSELEHIATDYGFLSKGILIEEISAQKLKAKCLNCIEMHVTDTEQFVALLDMYFPNEVIKMMPDQTIRIINPTKQSAAYSELAAQHGIYVIGMQQIRTSLEDYYMKLKEGV